MAIKHAMFLLLTLTTSACSAMRLETEEYGTNILARGLSICDAELWTSNEADEKICIRRSLQHPDRFLMTQDAPEYWKDNIVSLVFAALYAPYAAYGIPLKVPDDDTPAKWQKAADQYMRKHYGAKAELIMFKGVVAPDGYIFEVQPGDQVPSWEEKGLTEFVLASQMPEYFWRSLGREFAGRRPSGRKPINGSLGRSQSLTAMLNKAVVSSRQPQQKNGFVAVEILDPIEYRKLLASTAANAPAPMALSSAGAK